MDSIYRRFGSHHALPVHLSLSHSRSQRQHHHTIPPPCHRHLPATAIYPRPPFTRPTIPALLPESPSIHILQDTYRFRIHPSRHRSHVALWLISVSLASQTGARRLPWWIEIPLPRGTRVMPTGETHQIVVMNAGLIAAVS